jgi:hypothetical protein
MIYKDGLLTISGTPAQIYVKIIERENLQDLQSQKTAALNLLNQWRGEQRTAIGLTDTTFQELCYTGKALECQRWLSDTSSTFGLAGEATARGISNEAMAALVLGQWAAWQGASDQIEAAYVTAQAAIEAAQTVEEIETVLTGL